MRTESDHYRREPPCARSTLWPRERTGLQSSFGSFYLLLQSPSVLPYKHSLSRGQWLDSQTQLICTPLISRFHLVRHYLMDTLHWQSVLNAPLISNTSEFIAKILQKRANLRPQECHYAWTHIITICDGLLHFGQKISTIFEVQVHHYMSLSACAYRHN